MEDLVLRDLDIGRAGGGVSGVMVGHLGVGGVHPGPRVLLAVNLPGGDGRHRGQRPHGGTAGGNLQRFALGGSGSGQSLLQGEEGGLDAFLGDEGIFISGALHRLPSPELLYLGRGVEIELVWAELAWPALDLVEELHWDGKYALLGH